MTESAQFHTHYGVPLRSYPALDHLHLHSEAGVTGVGLTPGVELHFYSELSPSDTLFVAFHGAMRPDKDTYPRFERVESLQRRSQTFMSFADPTWHLNHKLALSWFLGGPEWDALDPIEAVIRRAMTFTGANRVIFVGGSGGGFAALRASIRFRHSLAYVQSPQTVVTRYVPDVVETYFESVWSRDKQDVTMSLPLRFDLASLYRENPGANYVYYLQNFNDHVHIRDHYKPFKRVHGVAEVHGTSNDGTKRFYLSDSQLLRHGPPTAAEFELNFDRALKFYGNATS